jgi:hypothetical protein
MWATLILYKSTVIIKRHDSDTSSFGHGLSFKESSCNYSYDLEFGGTLVGFAFLGSVVFCIMFCISLFDLLHLVFLPLYCIFELRLLVTMLVSSSLSQLIWYCASYLPRCCSICSNNVCLNNYNCLINYYVWIIKLIEKSLRIPTGQPEAVTRTYNNVWQFEDTKRLPRNRISKKNRQSNGKMKEDKQGSTKHYTEN